MSLKDRVAVVTGAGSGIGRAVALAMAARGAAVAAVDLDTATAQETAGLIASKAGDRGAVSVRIRATPSRSTGP